MAKYSYEFKLQVVQAYLDGEGVLVFFYYKIQGCKLQLKIKRKCLLMSLRPLSWSRHGVNQMAKLSIYKDNKGNMLETLSLY
jgi:hypothetical protein